MAVITSHAGNHGDAVIHGGLQHTPVVTLDFLNSHHFIGASAFRGGVGHFITDIHIFDGTDNIFCSTVMAAEPHIAVPNAGGGKVAQTLVHAGVGGAFPQVVVFYANGRNDYGYALRRY